MIGAAILGEHLFDGTKALLQHIDLCALFAFLFQDLIENTVDFLCRLLALFQIFLQLFHLFAGSLVLMYIEQVICFRQKDAAFLQ